MATVSSASAAAAADSHSVEPYSHDLSWYDTWLTQQNALEAASGGRRLLQPGVGYWTTPAKHTGSTSCTV